MAEIATIARPYAEALFKATSKDLNGAAVWVDALSAVAQNEQDIFEIGGGEVLSFCYVFPF